MSILAAVAPALISGLFGRKGTTTTTTEAYDFDRLRNNAQAAGFNPLTALMANGGTGGGTTTTTAAPGAFIGDALNAGVQSWFNRDKVQREDEIDRIQLETMRLERDQLKNQADFLTKSQQPFGSSIPSYETVQDRQPPKVPALTQGAPSNGEISPVPYVQNEDPVLVMAPDGMTRANPDSPIEIESDLGGWLREGTLAPNVRELVRRNLPEYMTDNWYYDRLKGRNKPIQLKPARPWTKRGVGPALYPPKKLTPRELAMQKRYGAP